MDSPIETSDKLRLDAAGRVDEDITCRTCGYNLRGLPRDGTCPECATAMSWSTHGDLLRFADPEWVRFLARGMDWIVAAIVCVFVAVVLSIMAAVTGFLAAAVWLGIGAGLVTLVGYWKVTTPDAGRIDPEPVFTARKLARVGLTAGVIGNAFAAWPAAAMTLALDPWVVQILGMVAGLVATIALFDYARQLALRLPNERLARHTRIVMWGLMLIMSVAVATLALMPVMVPSRLVFVPSGREVLLLSACGVGDVGLFFGIWAIILVLRYRNELHAAARMAAETGTPAGSGVARSATHEAIPVAGMTCALLTVGLGVAFFFSEPQRDRTWAGHSARGRWQRPTAWPPTARWRPPPVSEADRQRTQADEHLRRQQYEQAAAAYDEYGERLEAGDYPASAYNNLAWTYVAGPPEIRAAMKALPLALQAVAMEPDESNWRNTLGVTYYRLGLLDEAVEILESGEDGAFDDFFLAMSYRRLGRPAEARRAYDDAIQWWESRNRFTRDQERELTAFRAEANALLGIVSIPDARLPALPNILPNTLPDISDAELEAMRRFAREADAGIDKLRKEGKLPAAPPKPKPSTGSPDPAPHETAEPTKAEPPVSEPERKAVAALRALGARVEVENRKVVEVSVAEVTDTGLAHIKGLTGLKALDLWGSHVTDAGLANLKGLSDLEELTLDGTRVAGPGLKHLAGLTRLKVLDLNDTRVDDDGIAHLEGLTSLEVLVLSATRVTDAGLAHLKGLAGLKRLILTGAPVTDEGVSELKKALPQLTVIGPK